MYFFAQSFFAVAPGFSTYKNNVLDSPKNTK